MSANGGIFDFLDWYNMFNRNIFIIKLLKLSIFIIIQLGVCQYIAFKLFIFNELNNRLYQITCFFTFFFIFILGYVRSERTWIVNPVIVIYNLERVTTP